MATDRLRSMVTGAFANFNPHLNRFTRPMKRTIRIIGFASIGLFVLLVLTGCPYVVNPPDRAVVERLGVIHRVGSPGTHYRFPVIDRVYIYPTERIYETTTEPIEIEATRGESLRVRVRLSWRVCDPALCHKSYRGFRESVAHRELES